MKRGFRSSGATVKFLIKQGIIPFIVADYSKLAVHLLFYRDKKWLLCSCVKSNETGLFTDNLLVTALTEERADLIINEVSKLWLDINYLDRQNLYMCMSLVLDSLDGILEQYKDINDAKFTKDDFDKLSKIGFLSKYDPRFWSTD